MVGGFILKIYSLKVYIILTLDLILS